MTRLSAWLVLAIGSFLFISGLFVTLAVSGVFDKVEKDLLEYPMIGEMLSGIWETEIAGRTLAGEWARSVPFVQAFSILWTFDGIFLIWLGLSNIFLRNDWRRR